MSHTSGSQPFVWKKSSVLTAFHTIQKTELSVWHHCVASCIQINVSVSYFPTTEFGAHTGAGQGCLIHFRRGGGAKSMFWAQNIMHYATIVIALTHFSQVLLLSYWHTHLLYWTVYNGSQTHAHKGERQLASLQVGSREKRGEGPI